MVTFITQVARSLDRLESVSNFAEFVRAFTEFGGGMVELARLTAERRADLRDERRRAQVAAARNVLERSTLMLLTSSKVSITNFHLLTTIHGKYLVRKLFNITQLNIHICMCVYSVYIQLLQ